jgi:rifampicin phosphotransferase
MLSPSVATILLRLGVHERGWLPWSRADLFDEEAARIAIDLAALEPPPDASGRVLAHAIDQVGARLGAFLEVVSWGMIYAYVFFHLTAQLLARWLPDEDATATMSDLTKGLPGIRTFEIHDELVACAALARRNPAFASALQHAPADVAAECVAGGLGELGARIRDLIERHGHRFAGRDLSYPTWREQPSVVIEMVAKLAAEPERGAPRDARRPSHADLVRRTAERVATGLGGSVRRAIFERLLGWCERYYALRENMRYHADRYLAALRSLALSAADRLIAAGSLADRDQVFFLEAGELRAALLGTERISADVALRADERRRAYRHYRQSEAPESLVGDDDAPAAIAQATRRTAEVDGRSGRLTGLGVSPGRTEGAARVVRSLDDLNAVRAGEVIVAASTDPSWTSLLALAGGLVLEMGGLLSHGAIVARELGIPAVVNVADATRLLATGDRVLVDGAAGTVMPA